MKSVLEILKKGNSGLCCIQPTGTVFDALRLLAQYNVGALLVIDESRLVGVFSERDYTRKVALQGRSSKAVKVEEIMTRDVLVVTPNTNTQDCMALMSQNKIRHLPVLDGDAVVGMISILDLMDDIIADQQVTIKQLQNYIHS